MLVLYWHTRVGKSDYFQNGDGQSGTLVPTTDAVIHVLVDDPTKGYAIFTENMLETAQSIADKQLKEVS